MLKGIFVLQSNKYDRISHFYLTVLILSSIANNLKSMKGVSVLGVLLEMMAVFFFLTRSKSFKSTFCWNEFTYASTCACLLNSNGVSLAFQNSCWTECTAVDILRCSTYSANVNDKTQSHLPLLPWTTKVNLRALLIFSSDYGGAWLMVAKVFGLHVIFKCTQFCNWQASKHCKIHYICIYVHPPANIQFLDISLLLLKFKISSKEKSKH